MGAVGGGIWHSVKGAKNSPRVCIRRNKRERVEKGTDYVCVDRVNV